MLERERLFERSFYVLDVETNGFKHNEPLQIGAILYDDGVEEDIYNQYFLSEHGSTREALRVHGLNTTKLKEMKATRFSKTQAMGLMRFLNQRKQLPITSFNVRYDRDKVLMPAFKGLDLGEMNAAYDRWRCAQELCKRTKNWRLWSLDDALEHFGYRRREEDAFHDALDDARLTAKVYMQAVRLHPLKDCDLGFIKSRSMQCTK